jgi:hypothetical protein
MENAIESFQSTNYGNKSRNYYLMKTYIIWKYKHLLFQPVDEDICY